jgi:hypothetical protein
MCTWEGVGKVIPKPPDGGVRILSVLGHVVQALELSTYGMVWFRFHGYILLELIFCYMGILRPKALHIEIC